MKTAVDYIVGMANELGYIPSEFYDKAKELERLQIIDAYENGVGDENERNLSGQFTNAEKHYNQTYNK